jgi:hypothetical protein
LPFPANSFQACPAASVRGRALPPDPQDPDHATHPDLHLRHRCPRLILRAEGAALLAAATVAYAQTGSPWGLFAALFLAPDIFMLGYLAGPRLGAATYNLGHTTILPVAVVAAGLALSVPQATAIGLIWLAHVGFDRLAGYGLMYPTAFRHTHLG